MPMFTDSSVDLLEKVFKKQTASGAPVSTAPPVMVGRESTTSVGSFLEQLRGALGPLTGAGLNLLFAGQWMRSPRPLLLRVCSVPQTARVWPWSTRRASWHFRPQQRSPEMQAPIQSFFPLSEALKIGICDCW